MEIPGIDVSKHNGVVDWSKVAASGKKFAFIRAGWAGYDGRIAANDGLDSLFHANMVGALAAGMDVGIYIYSYCKSALAARAAAEEALSLVRGYKLRYPIAFDIEDSQYFTMGSSMNTAIAEAFLSRVGQAGYCGMLYTYKSFAESHLNMSDLAGYDVWIAQFAASCTYSGDYGIWQHHGDKQKHHPAGSCPGVNGACDLNTAYKDYPALIRAAGLNGLEVDLPEKPDAGAERLANLEDAVAKIKDILAQVS